MAKKILRQGLLVSIDELRNMAKKLDGERKEQKKKLGTYCSTSKRWLISIINKEPECSDTWEIEE